MHTTILTEIQTTDNRIASPADTMTIEEMQSRIVQAQAEVRELKRQMRELRKKHAELKKKALYASQVVDMYLFWINEVISRE